MSLREILKIPAPLLRAVARPVERIDRDVEALAEDMFATMYDAPGIGLAAPQVGVLKRVVVIDTARDEEPPEPICLINPQIVWASQELSEHEEGCLSIPETYEKVTRPAEVKVRFLDRAGKAEERHCEGLLATCVQHEIDHLDGVLFIDHISRLKRERIIKKFAKAEKLRKGAA